MSATPDSHPDHGHKPAGHAHGADCGCEHDHHDHGQGHQHGHEAVAHPAGEAEWTKRFLLFLELGVLLIWAVMMVWFYASGRINSYLIGEGTFRIQVLVGGLILAVLGIFNWQMRAQPESCGHDHAEGGCCDHDHDHDHDTAESHSHEGTPAGRGLALALLALSVTASVVLTPDEFSDKYKRNMLAAYASRTGSDTKAPEAYRLTPEGSPTEAAAGGMTLAVVEKYRPRNKEGNFELGVEELYYSSADPEYAKVMKGQGVETVGQIVKDTSSTEPGRWRVFVLQMTCCAADARPVSLPVVFQAPVPAGLQEMGWFKLTGQIDYVEERGIPVAVLRASSAQPSLRPKEQRSLF